MLRLPSLPPSLASLAPRHPGSDSSQLGGARDADAECSFASLVQFATLSEAASASGPLPELCFENAGGAPAAASATEPPQQQLQQQQHQAAPVWAAHDAVALQAAAAAAAQGSFLYAGAAQLVQGQWAAASAVAHHARALGRSATMPAADRQSAGYGMPFSQPAAASGVAFSAAPAVSQPASSQSHGSLPVLLARHSGHPATSSFQSLSSRPLPLGRHTAAPDAPPAPLVDRAWAPLYEVPAMVTGHAGSSAAGDFGRLRRYVSGHAVRTGPPLQPAAQLLQAQPDVQSFSELLAAVEARRGIFGIATTRSQPQRPPQLQQRPPEQVPQQAQPIMSAYASGQQLAAQQAVLLRQARQRQLKQQQYEQQQQQQLEQQRRQQAQQQQQQLQQQQQQQQQQQLLQQQQPVQQPAAFRFCATTAYAGGLPSVRLVQQQPVQQPAAGAASTFRARLLQASRLGMPTAAAAQPQLQNAASGLLPALHAPALVCAMRPRAMAAKPVAPAVQLRPQPYAATLNPAAAAPAVALRVLGCRPAELLARWARTLQLRRGETLLLTLHMWERMQPKVRNQAYIAA